MLCTKLGQCREGGSIPVQHAQAGFGTKHCETDVSSSPTPAKSSGRTKTGYATSSEPQKVHSLTSCSMLRDKALRSCVSSLLPQNATNTGTQLAQTQKVFCESLTSRHRQTSGQSIAKQKCLPRQHQPNQAVEAKQAMPIAQNLRRFTPSPAAVCFGTKHCEVVCHPCWQRMQLTQELNWLRLRRCSANPSPTRTNCEKDVSSSPTPAKSSGRTKTGYANSSEPQKVHSLTSCSMLRDKALRSCVSSLLPKNATNTRTQLAQTQKVF